MHCDVYSARFYVFVRKNVLNISKIYCKSKTDKIKIHRFKNEENMTEKTNIIILVKKKNPKQ